ncbi:hypothetical protein DBV15_00390 [Temnothorax longispinosus]|uniref:Uncharacterized protein n=1 Tax=Temnothorax longispinosus TaxID=300112 RepID=A0A4S2JQU9_9HYME|nr:hypothetical protein DBV15_00390 [Temnothorax longispinosus]
MYPAPARHPAAPSPQVNVQQLPFIEPANGRYVGITRLLIDADVAPLCSRGTKWLDRFFDEYTRSARRTYEATAITVPLVWLPLVFVFQVCHVFRVTVDRRYNGKARLDVRTYEPFSLLANQINECTLASVTLKLSGNKSAPNERFASSSGSSQQQQQQQRQRLCRGDIICANVGIRLPRASKNSLSDEKCLG